VNHNSYDSFGVINSGLRDVHRGAQRVEFHDPAWFRGTFGFVNATNNHIIEDATATGGTASRPLVDSDGVLPGAPVLALLSLSNLQSFRCSTPS
jgi:hypothetical protein